MQTSRLIRTRDSALALSLLCVSSCSLLTDDSIPKCLSDRDCKHADSTPANTSGSPAISGTGGAGNATSNSGGSSASGGIPVAASAGAEGNLTGGAGGSAGAPENGGASGSAGAAGSGGASCTPSPETCNSKDDNCNVAVDEGCPVGITWDTAQDRPALGDSPFGSTFGDQCEKDQVLVGLRLTFTKWLDAAAGICAKPVISFNAAGEPKISFSAPKTLPQHPTSNETPTDMTCAAGEIVVGVRISQQHSALGAADDRVVIPAVWLTCAELYLSSSPKPAAITAQWRTPREIGPQQGSLANTTAWFHSDALQTGNISVRFLGTAENWIHRLGFGTSSLALKRK